MHKYERSKPRKEIMRNGRVKTMAYFVAFCSKKGEGDYAAGNEV